MLGYDLVLATARKWAKTGARQPEARAVPGSRLGRQVLPVYTQDLGRLGSRVYPGTIVPGYTRSLPKFRVYTGTTAPDVERHALPKEMTTASHYELPC